MNSHGLAWTVVAVALAWFCVNDFGVIGAGIAFFGSYIFHGILSYAIARHLSDFRWAGIDRKIGVIFLSLIAVVFCGFYVLPLIPATCVGVLALSISGVYAIRVLLRLVPSERIPPIVTVLKGFGLMPSAAIEN